MTDEALPTAQELYKSFIKEKLSPALRKLGFKGSSGRYTLASDSCWIFLSLQGNKWNTKEEVEFTINLKVVHRAAWQRAAAEPRSWLPAQPDPSAQFGLFPFEETTRLALTVPGATQDRWCALTRATDTDQLFTEVHDMIRDFGLPWLREHEARMTRDLPGP